MGTIRFTADGEHGLYDHEGHIAAELDMDDPLIPGRRWVGYFSGEVAGHFTGRYRARCECGWEGPVVDAAVRWPELAEPRRGWLPEVEEDEVLADWMRHTDPLIADLDLTAPLRELADELADLDRRLAEQVKSALAAGATRAQLAAALPHRSAATTIAAYCTEAS